MIRRLGLITGALLFVLGASAAPAMSQEAAEQSTCIQCHLAMGEPRLTKPVEDWRSSIHAKNGVSCNACHWGDPTSMDIVEAMSPEKGFKGAPKPEAVPDFCGACHVGVKEDYLTSAHGQALDHGGPQCVTCHENHAIQQASIQLINPQSCTRCHGYERAALIRDALAATDESIVSLDRQLKSLQRIGFEVADLQSGLFETRNTFHRLFHSNEIKQQVDGIEATLARRKQGGAVVVAMLLVLTALLFYVRHTYKIEEKQTRPKG